MSGGVEIQTQCDSRSEVKEPDILGLTLKVYVATTHCSVKAAVVNM